MLIHPSRIPKGKLLKTHRSKLHSRHSAEFSLRSILNVAAFLQLAVKIQLPTAPGRNGSVGPTRGAQGEYLLSYLDEDTLIGRAQQGIFIFERYVGNDA